MGLVSEIDEVLRELRWKAHRAEDGEPVVQNITWELADLLKYVLSIAELWEIAPEQLLEIAEQKSQVLRLTRHMDRVIETMRSQRVMMVDLDGTLADWRRTFHQWVAERIEVPEFDPRNTLAFEVDLGIPFREYNRLKNQFEEEGGYASLLPIKTSIQTVRQAQARGIVIVVHTARPSSRLKRVWWDSYSWLKSHEIFPDVLRIGSLERILASLRLAEKNRVVMLEDDPELALRAANAGIQVFLRSTPYNAHVAGMGIVRLGELLPDYEYFRGVS
jgi:uncharacterized HAD superfamily protein/NTP pyrophosphatase (non-canonical NTP hydrolase)